MANCICGRTLDGHSLATTTGMISTNFLGTGCVTAAKIAAGMAKVTLVAGGSAGDHTVAGMAVGDEITCVLHISTAADVATIADLTSEFTAAAGKATNAAGTDTTSDQLLFFWNDLT